jgi:hypothetical protein
VSLERSGLTTPGSLQPDGLHVIEQELTGDEWVVVGMLQQHSRRGPDTAVAAEDVSHAHSESVSKSFSESQLRRLNHVSPRENNLA